MGARSRAADFLPSTIGLIVGAVLALTCYAALSAVAQRQASIAAAKTLDVVFTPALSYSCPSEVEFGRSLLCRVDYSPQHPTSKNKFLHVDIVAPNDKLDVSPVLSSDIQFVPAKSTMSWLLTPKDDGLIDYVVRYEPYETDASGAKHDVPKTQFVKYALNVYEPVLGLAWFQNHAFAASLVIALIPLLGGAIGAAFGKGGSA